jgi:hypothetical protein
MKIKILTALLGMLFLVGVFQACEKSVVEKKTLSKEEALSNLKKSIKEINTVSLRKSMYLKSGAVNTDEVYIEQLKPVLVSSKELLDVYDINSNSDFNSENDPQIIVTALLILTLEKEFSSIEMQKNMSNYKSIRRVGAWDCAMEAIGVGAVSELIGALGSSAAIKASKAVILKAVGKIASKYAGWIGAAVMVADFAECMYTGD